jgi:hypothetical protein
MLRNPPRFKVEDVERALRASHGLIHPAAKILEAAYGSCTPATVRNYLKRHKTLRAAVEETIEFNLDLAETKLLKAIDRDSLPAAIFYLRYRGQARGYVLRVETTGAGGGPIAITVEMVRNARQRNVELVDGLSKRLTSGIARALTASHAGQDPERDEPGGGS